jgi:hypothetical protein
LATVGIYTFDDTVELENVFGLMKKMEAEHPVIEPASNPASLREYFEKVLPEHDPEKVHISDIKKLIKWYEFLNSRGLIELSVSSEEE